MIILNHQVLCLNLVCCMLIYLAFMLTRTGSGRDLLVTPEIHSSNMLHQVFYLTLFSLLSCILYLLLDAPDVAMTEAAIGACISTVIFTNLVKHFDFQNSKLKGIKNFFVILICMGLGLCLIYASQDLPSFGSHEAPLHGSVSKYYIENTEKDIGIPAFVAAILASYRGYDTMGETLVILTAMFSVLFILKKEKADVLQ